MTVHFGLAISAPHKLSRQSKRGMNLPTVAGYIKQTTVDVYNGKLRAQTADHMPGGDGSVL